MRRSLHFAWNGWATEPFLATTSAAVGEPATARAIDSFVLREDGLVVTRREAQTIFYALAEGPAQRIIATLHGVYCANEHPICDPG